MTQYRVTFEVRLPVSGKDGDILDAIEDFAGEIEDIIVDVTDFQAIIKAGSVVVEELEE